MTKDLSKQEINRFQSDGVVFVKNAIDQNWVDRMLTVIDQQMDSPGK